MTAVAEPLAQAQAQRRAELLGHKGGALGILIVAFAPDGKTLASGCGSDPKVRLWNLTVPAIRQLDGPYLERVREALTDPAAKRRALFRPDAVERMLREPNVTRTTLGSNALWQLALLEMWLQKVDESAR